MTDSTSEYTETASKKPPKEITVVQDTGCFQHDTGDKYDGFFEAKKKDKSVRMHGPGTYTTAEGDIYSGTWDADKLGANEEVVISYVDGTRYEGLMKDWSYSGQGKYVYPDSSLLQCDFVDNCPVGNLSLTDPNGHVWLAKAAQGFACFEPVNHYYEMLEKTRESGRIKKRHKHRPSVPVIEEVAPPLAPKKSVRLKN